MKKFILIILLILFSTVACGINEENTDLDINSSTGKIAYVVFDYSNAFSDGERFLNESLSDIEKIKDNYNMDIIVSEVNEDMTINADNIVEWIEDNADFNKVIILEQKLYEIVNGSPKALSVLNSYNNLTIGVMSGFYIENDSMPENVDFVVYCNDDESYGRTTARRCAELFNGAKGSIILDRSGTSGLSGAIYYQHYFVDEFKILQSQYDLTEISLIYDGEVIYATDDEKADILKETDILAVIEGYGNADWDYILEKVNALDISRFSLSKETVDKENVEEYVSSCTNTIKTSIRYAEDIIDGKKVPQITKVDCERLR